MSDVSILNVGTGDTRLSFDKNNPAERIRAARIVKDMLRRGYALLVERPAGSGTYTRALDFDENTCEYIIADLDPVAAAAADAVEPAGGTDGQQGEAETKPAAADPAGTAKKRAGRTRVPAESTKAVGVARIAGG